MDRNILLYVVDINNKDERFIIYIEKGIGEFEIDEININGEIYSNSIILEEFEFNKLVSRIVYTKGIGLIQFTINNEEWNLITEHKCMQ